MEKKMDLTISKLRAATLLGLALMLSSCGTPTSTELRLQEYATKDWVRQQLFEAELLRALSSPEDGGQTGYDTVFDIHPTFGALASLSASLDSSTMNSNLSVHLTLYENLKFREHGATNWTPSFGPGSSPPSVNLTLVLEPNGQMYLTRPGTSLPIPAASTPAYGQSAITRPAVVLTENDGGNSKYTLQFHYGQHYWTIDVQRQQGP